MEKSVTVMFLSSMLSLILAVVIGLAAAITNSNLFFTSCIVSVFTGIGLAVLAIMLSIIDILTD